ncbi:MAG: ABC transporter ATP-binding protein [Rhodospirillaceae bacterium]|nr:ABC transporter ATP-binding protein [Rhodospirillaceae bacterium]
MTEVILETRALTRRFGALAAVNNVTLSFKKGEMHAVIGPNGAGKSTLINLLSGDLHADSGNITYQGSDIDGLPPDRIARKGIGRSYQKTNIMGGFTCFKNCWLGAYAARASRMGFFKPASAYQDLNTRAEQALELCGMLRRRDRTASSLSHGEQHRLEIAMMLAAGPQLLLLDEPLAGMGPDETLHMIDLLKKLSLEHTIVLIEHDMDAVFQLADTISVMVDGEVLETGTPEKIKNSTAVRRAYLGNQDEPA